MSDDIDKKLRNINQILIILFILLGIALGILLGITAEIIEDNGYDPNNLNIGYNYNPIQLEKDTALHNN